MMDQVFAPPEACARVPARSWYAGTLGSCGTGFQVQRSAPVRASKARTSPLAPTVELLSAMAEPTTMRSLITAGGEVCSYSSPKDCVLRSPSIRSTVPPLPKPLQGLPSRASSCTSRASITPMMTRARAGRAGLGRRVLPERHAAIHPVAEVALALHLDFARPACLPVTGSSAITLPSGVARYITPSITSGVASRAVGLPVSMPASPVLYSQASCSFVTFSR